MAEHGLPSAGELVAGRYQLEDRLGQGGMAVVHRARHTGTGKTCAVKFLLPHLVEDEKQREQFLREAQVAGRIESHPNIVEVFDTGLDPARGVPFIAMELLRGETLARYAKRAGPVPWPLAATMLEQIADALDAAHAAGVVHRDLKPGNVFVTPGRKGELVLKVLDFGIAKIVEGMMDGQTATQVGTPWYSAPEQLGGSMRRLAADRGITIAPAVCAATDVWALSLIAFELLSGVTPKHYWGTQTLVDQLVKLTLEERAAPSLRVGDRARYLPPGFDDWFICCTRHNAAERYPSAGQAVAALVSLLQGAGAQASPLQGAGAQAPPPRSSVSGAMGYGPQAPVLPTPSAPGFGGLGYATPASGPLVPPSFGPGLGQTPSGSLAMSGPLSGHPVYGPGPSGPQELAAPTAFLGPDTSPRAPLESLGSSGPLAGPGAPPTGPSALSQSGALSISGPLGTTSSARMLDTAGSWQQDAAAAAERAGRRRSTLWLGGLGALAAVALGSVAAVVMLGGGRGEAATVPSSAATGASQGPSPVPAATETDSAGATAPAASETSPATDGSATSPSATAGGSAVVATPGASTSQGPPRGGAGKTGTGSTGGKGKEGGDGFNDMFGKR